MLWGQRLAWEAKTRNPLDAVETPQGEGSGTARRTCTQYPKYNIMMLPILIKSFLNTLELLAVTTQLGKLFHVVNNPVSKVKLTHITFKARLLES